MWSSRDVNHEDKLTAIMTTKRNCNLLSTGDIVSWKEFENVNLDFVFKQFPSDCDGMLGMVASELLFQIPTSFKEHPTNCRTAVVHVQHRLK